jgi:Co/Zn/Cd efflux system component
MQHEHRRDITWFLVCLCISFLAFMVDVAGGALSSSLTLAGDGAHVLLDGVAFGVAILIAWRSNPSIDALAKLEGHARGRRVIALLMGCTVLLLTFGVMWRLNGQAPLVHAESMSLAGAIGAGLNGAQYIILRRGKSELRYALSRHVLVDCIISVSATIGALLMIWVDLEHIDTLLTLGIMIWIGCEAVSLWRGRPHTH